MQLLFQQRNGKKRKTYLEKIGLSNKIQNIDDFNKEYAVCDEVCVGGQGSIYSIKRHTNYENKSEEEEEEGNETCFISELIVKKVSLKDFDDIKSELISLLTLYEHISSLSLLNYYGLYYDEYNKEFLILTQKLTVTLTDFQHSLPKNFCDFGFRECYIKRIMFDILSQLTVLHNSGFIHCDINPSNIMYDSHSNQWKLIDYDMIFEIDATKGYAMDCWKGTVGWTPKEIGHNLESSQNKYTFASDLWSFGLVLFYLLNDFKNPFDVTSNETVLYQLNDKNDKLEYYYQSKLVEKHCVKVKELMGLWMDNGKISQDLYDLLVNRLLVLDEKKRAQSCVEVAAHPWFQSYIL